MENGKKWKINEKEFSKNARWIWVQYIDMGEDWSYSSVAKNNSQIYTVVASAMWYYNQWLRYVMNERHIWFNISERCWQIFSYSWNRYFCCAMIQYVELTSSLIYDVGIHERENESNRAECCNFLFCNSYLNFFTSTG